MAAKLAPKFSGPFIVVEVISPNIYKLASPDGRLSGLYHASHLKRYAEDPEDEPSNSDELVELDRMLLEIRDSDAEIERVDDDEEALENSESNFNWGLGNAEQHSDSDGADRVKLRTRSYSE